MEGLQTQRPTESLSANKHISAIITEIGAAAEKAAQTTKGYIASKDRDPEMAMSTKQIMDLISVLTVGEVLIRTTAEAILHPSPTARIHALSTNATARKIWTTIITTNQGSGNPSTDTHTNLRSATMCMLLKLEGTDNPKWRGATQLMNWVANNIPIMATSNMRDIFPALDLKRNEHKPLASLLNKATKRQWGDKGLDQLLAADQEVPYPLRYTQEEWEAGHYCKRKLNAITGHPLGTKICQMNTLILLYAVADLYNEETVKLGKKGATPGAKRAAKEALRHMAMQGANNYLETSEVDYDGERLEQAIERAFESKKDRLGTLLRETHEATKRGGGPTMADRFSGKGTKCPDCARIDVERDIILDPATPHKGIIDHLLACGVQKNNKRKGSPHRDGNIPKRGNNEPLRTDRQSPGTSPRGMPRGNRGTALGNRGNRGRGNNFGNSPRRGFAFPNFHQNLTRFQTSNNTEQGPWPNNMYQHIGGNNAQGAGYQTQEYRDNMAGTQNQEPWAHRGGHHR